jgi:hypothetical protein
MSRSRRRASRAPIAALIASLALLLLLAPSAAQAGLPYEIQWLFLEEDPVCESADLGKHNGEAFFHVNDTPLPTRQLPGALVTNPDGSESNTAQASFDSVLLRTGANDFHFDASNDTNNSCVHSSNVVNLVSTPLGLQKTLFAVRRDGTAFSGSTGVSLSLAEINPPLARDIANLEVALAGARQALIANASRVADLAAKLSLLQQLDTELHDLVNRPIDEIAQTDLDAILDRYSDTVDEATRAALEQLLADLKQSEIDLQDQLASLIQKVNHRLRRCDLTRLGRPVVHPDVSASRGSK